MLAKRRITRVAAATVTAFALVAAPQAAMAEVDNLFKVWATEVTDRSMYEVPFALIVSLPALVISAPFWFGVWSVDKIKMSRRGENTFDYDDEFADKTESEKAAAAEEAIDEEAPTGEDAGEEGPADEAPTGEAAAEEDSADEAPAEKTGDQ